MTDNEPLFSATLKKWLTSKSRPVFEPEAAKQWKNKVPPPESPLAYLQWANAHPFIKVASSRIPAGIVQNAPKDTAFVLHDIRVAPPRARKKGGMPILDDDVYDMFEPLRLFVPRGVCILEINAPKMSPQYYTVIYAMKKCTGGPGDDDDEDDAAVEDEASHDIPDDKKPRWEYYFIEPHKNATTIIRTTKENGDSAHLAFFEFFGEIYYVIGSKNVHLLVRGQADIEKYLDSRFRIAKLMAHDLLAYMERQLKPGNRIEFTTFMLKHCFTATFEYLQVEHQHIELFDFPKSKFRFIAFTSFERPTELCFDIVKGAEVAQQAGWETISVAACAAEDQESLFTDIRTRTYGKEGSVLYYVNQDGRIIGMMKKKTIWYIIIRSIREKTKGMIASMAAKKKSEKDIDPADILHKYSNNMGTVMAEKRDWLKLSESATAAWLAVATAFLGWILPKIVDGKVDSEQFSATYPILWNQFLSNTNTSDKIA